MEDKTTTTATTTIFRVIKSKVLLNHIFQFIPIINRQHQQQQFNNIEYTKFKDLSYISISNLRCCHTTDDTNNNNNNNNNNQKSIIEQQQRSFNLFRYKLLNDAQFVVYFRAMPVILRNCKDVKVLQRLYQLYPHYFDLPFDLGSQDTNLVDSKSWVVDNVAASGSVECLVYAIQTIGIEPTTVTLDTASEYGQLSTLDYLTKTYPHLKVDRGVELAATNSHLNVIEYLLNNRPTSESFSSMAILNAARNNNSEKDINLKIATLLFSHLDRCPPPKSGVTGFTDNTVPSRSLDMVKLYYNRLGEDSVTTLAINMASELGYLDIVMYLDQVGAPATADAMDYSAKNGHLNVLRYLHEQRRGSVCTKEILKKAVYGGHSDIVRYLQEESNLSVLQPFEPALKCAALAGSMELVRYLQQTRSETYFQWTGADVINIISEGRDNYESVLIYLFDSGLWEQLISNQSETRVKDYIASVHRRDSVPLFEYIVEKAQLVVDIDPNIPVKVMFRAPFWDHLLVAPPRAGNLHKPHSSSSYSNNKPHCNIKTWLLKRNKHLLNDKHYAYFLQHALVYSLELVEYIWRKCPESFSPKIFDHLDFIGNVGFKNDRVEFLDFLHRNDLFKYIRSYRAMVESAFKHSAIKCIKYLRDHCQLVELIDEPTKLELFNSTATATTSSKSLELFQFCFIHFFGSDKKLIPQLLDQETFNKVIRNGSLEMVHFQLENQLVVQPILTDVALEQHQPTVIDKAAQSTNIELLCYMIARYPNIRPTKLSFEYPIRSVVGCLVQHYPSNYLLKLPFLNYEYYATNILKECIKLKEKKEKELNNNNNNNNNSLYDRFKQKLFNS
ncbi:hypothetical protein DFA_04301 [Cavenderia fasciculata]|uniref:Ankyrin repeat-containing protein n=1 Tax=Cavenderia fasciculata TaxID=261658 RepID=F4PP70_CACFS|nr:uncharacterized protein DFA_04301 [Cavenderia fasciculata]EGG22183.1 hypothetical protein DFA_04301 [Cavenderia fasciculata]|eukprot:XP_004360034.1 hypothetical protein DFA_04301 [Cavenderia fasciculata]